MDATLKKLLMITTGIALIIGALLIKDDVFPPYPPTGAATWTTPSSVSSYSSQDGTSVAANSKDDSNTSHWDEQFFGDVDGAVYEWYITYDMGSTYTVERVRILAKGDISDAPCSVGVIKVCDDAACSGESNVLPSVCNFSGSLEWQVCDPTDTQGRYIYLAGGLFSGVCINKDESMFGYMQNYYEFDAEVSAADSTPPTYSSDSDDSSGSVTAGTVVNTSVYWTDAASNLDTGVFYHNASGSMTQTSTCDMSSGQTAWCNKTIDTTGNGSNRLCWKQYANDTGGNLNNTMTDTAHCFNVTSVGAPDLNWSYYNGSAWNEYTTSVWVDFRCSSTENNCEPDDQNAGSSQCIWKVCNNGTAAGTSVKLKTNATLSCTGGDIDLFADDDYTAAGSVNITSTYGEVHGALAQDACQEICLWANYSSVVPPCNYYEPKFQIT